jgi:hypothetical protein
MTNEEKCFCFPKKKSRSMWRKFFSSPLFPKKVYIRGD